MINEKKLFNWAKDIFPIYRSITGEGVRQTLRYLKTKVPSLKIKSVPSGKKVFGWKIPLEWSVIEAYIKNKKGKKVVDFKKNNLHLVSYSSPINKKIRLNDLKKKALFAQKPTVCNPLYHFLLF